MQVCSIVVAGKQQPVWKRAYVLRTACFLKSRMLVEEDGSDVTGVSMGTFLGQRKSDIT